MYTYYLQLLFDGNIVSLLKDAVMMAGWLDVSVEPSLLVVDIQVCKQHAAVLFTVSSDSQSEYGIG